MDQLQENLFAVEVAVMRKKVQIGIVCLRICVTKMLTERDLFCYPKYRVSNNFTAHDMPPGNIFFSPVIMNWHHSWMFPTVFPTIRKLVPNYASSYVFFT